MSPAPSLPRLVVVGAGLAGLTAARALSDSDGHTRYRGVGSMNAVASHLATGLDVRRSTTVASVARDGRRWTVRTDAEAFEADAVLSGRAAATHLLG